MSTVHGRFSEEFRLIFSRLQEYGSRLARMVSRSTYTMAASDDSADLSDSDRSMLRAVANDKKRYEKVRQNQRLIAIVDHYDTRADREIRQSEAVRLNVPVHRKTLLQVAARTFLDAAEQVVSDYLRPRSEDGMQKDFGLFCYWVATGEEIHRPNLTEAGEALDTPEFRSEYLLTLWHECESECRDIGLPGPLMTDGQLRIWSALAGQAATGKELARLLQMSEDTVRAQVRLMNKSGHLVKNRRGRGYYRPDAPPNVL